MSDTESDLVHTDSAEYLYLAGYKGILPILSSIFESVSLRFNDSQPQYLSGSVNQ